MRIRQLRIQRFRGLRELTFAPGASTLILGPNNAGKSAVLEALDLLLHSGLGRARPALTEIDYFGRDPAAGFCVEAVIGALPSSFTPEVRQHLEGWKADSEEVVPEPEGDGIEPVVRIRVRGTDDFDVVHEFSKEEASGMRLSPRLRSQVGWIFDGRTRDPLRQLAFFQGGLLDRLFADVSLDPAVAALRKTLAEGTTAVNAEPGVKGRLDDLASDLKSMGVLLGKETPGFELGAVSERNLLQSLQLSLPVEEILIPVFRQGRGAQRLVLVSILLRLAKASGQPAIAGFEEPEEALEPLRQSQMARLLAQIVDGGGQVFVVTHSPEIARAFLIDDFLLLDERASGSGARQLRKVLSVPVRQTYERWLDGAVVRGLFARIPLLVEGPGDRAVVETFWRAMALPKAQEKSLPTVRPAEQLGIDVVNCEGVSNMPMIARLLREAGKQVVAWAERDREDVREVLERLRAEGHCSAIVLHDDATGKQNLEEALAQSATIPALIEALGALATTRGYSFEEQRATLVSTVEGIDEGRREALKRALSLQEFFVVLTEPEKRALISRALSAKKVTPFEMKGARQGRIVAETILEVDRQVPLPFARAIVALDRWIADGRKAGTEVTMAK